METMGLPSSAHGPKNIDTQEPQGSASSSSISDKHGSDASDYLSHEDVLIRTFAHPRRGNGSRGPPHSLNPHTSHGSQHQDTIPVFHRNPQDLYKEAFYEVSLDTGTNYPCTKGELNASGGVNRHTAMNARNKKDKTKWFPRKNKGPFVEARTAAREVFDHNHPRRIPSAAEDEAMSRLMTAFGNAGREPWGPDLAIKAFCDLDKVFFCGRLKGHVCLTWERDNAFDKNCWGSTHYVHKGKCVILLNADQIFFRRLDGSGFVQMFSTLLHEMCHAYLETQAKEKGHGGWSVGRADGHGKNFATSLYAVNSRAWNLLGFEGDSTPYLRHEYAYYDHSHPAPRHPNPAPKAPFHEPPSRAPSPPPGNSSRWSTPRKSRQELHDDAFEDVTLDSGTEYTCKQSDLDATGGLARREYPKDDRKDRKASRKRWFPRKNQGPFVTPRQACLEIFEHNDLRRKPGNLEMNAIERISSAIAAGHDGIWGPDLIIKAFCDLDIIFFRGRLRGHVCVRWLRDWSTDGKTTWGTTVFLGEGKCVIKMNADTILLGQRHPFKRMFATMLHEMCHADADTQVLEHELLNCVSHGKNFGTRYYAVEARAKRLFGFLLVGDGAETYPRHKYEKGEGFL